MIFDPPVKIEPQLPLHPHLSISQLATDLAGSGAAFVSTFSRGLEWGEDALKYLGIQLGRSSVGKALRVTGALEKKLSWAGLAASACFTWRAFERSVGAIERKKDDPTANEDLSSLASYAIMLCGFGAKFLLKNSINTQKWIGRLSWGASALIDGIDTLNNWKPKHFQDNLLRLATFGLFTFGRSDRALWNGAQRIWTKAQPHLENTLLLGAASMALPGIAEAANGGAHGYGLGLLGLAPLAGAAIRRGIKRLPAYPGHELVLQRALHCLSTVTKSKGHKLSPCAEWAGAGVPYHLAEILAADPEKRTQESVLAHVLRSVDQTKTQLYQSREPSHEVETAIEILKNNASTLHEIAKADQTGRTRVALHSLFYLTGSLHPEIYSFPSFYHPPYEKNSPLDLMGHGTLDFWENLIISQRGKWKKPKILLLGPRDTQKDLWHAMRFLRKSPNGGEIHAYDVDNRVHFLERENHYLRPEEKLIIHSGTKKGNFLNLEGAQADLVLVLFPHFGKNNQSYHDKSPTWVYFNEKGNLAPGGMIVLTSDSLGSPALEALMGSIGMFPTSPTLAQHDWIQSPELTVRMREKTKEFYRTLNMSGTLTTPFPPIFWHPFQGGSQAYHTYGPLVVMQNAG